MNCPNCQRAMALDPMGGYWCHTASCGKVVPPPRTLASLGRDVSSTIPCVWCYGRGYVYVTGKRCEGCLGTGRLKDYSAKAGAEPESLTATAAENTENQIALRAGSAETGGEKVAPHLKYRTIRNKREALAESSLSSPPHRLDDDGK